jgi:hypothetical protein
MPTVRVEAVLLTLIWHSAFWAIKTEELYWILAGMVLHAWTYPLKMKKRLLQSLAWSKGCCYVLTVQNPARCRSPVLSLLVHRGRRQPSRRLDGVKIIYVIPMQDRLEHFLTYEIVRWKHFQVTLTHEADALLSDTTDVNVGTPRRSAGSETRN